MIISAKYFWLPKQGNAADEYEDAYHSHIDKGCFAIADGATESSFARNWANILVSGFIEDQSLQFNSSADQVKKWLEPLQRMWSEVIKWESLPWFAVEKAEAGAFSSLLGLEFDASATPQQLSTLVVWPDKGLHWHAIAVGDSCLFQVRDDSLIDAFPFNRPEEFSSRPLLLSSKHISNQRVWDEIQFRDGSCQLNDIFFMATDALACWFLAEHQAGLKPWLKLSAFEKDEEFTSFITNLRQAGSIRNDDVTLFRIRLCRDDIFAYEKDKSANDILPNDNKKIFPLLSKLQDFLIGQRKHRSKTP